MAMITAEEQLALRNKAKAELQRLETVDADLANRFKAKYGVCEIVYKVILADHQIAKGKSADYLKVIMTQVPYALNYMAALYPYLLHLMEEYVFTPYGVGVNEIKVLSDTIYGNAKKVNDYESICYAIYFALRYDFFLDELDRNYVIRQKDCITLVMTWLYYMKVNHWKRDATEVKPFNKLARELKTSEMGRYWLFCYEALKAGSLPGDWKAMKQADVSFIKPEYIGKSNGTSESDSTTN